MEKVSILIPCYNNGEWIQRAIDSALSQTYPEFEVIVLDDGSSDNSLELIQQYGSRIRWESGPNRGGNVARNRLLEMADGDWIQYLDADDALESGKVASQMRLIEEGIDAIYGKVQIEHWAEQEIVGRELSDPKNSGDIYCQWLEWKLAQTGSVLWRRQSLERIGGWNESYPCCQDNEICLRALKAGLHFRYSEDAGTIYRLWSSSTVSRKKPDLLLKTITALIDEMIDWLREQNLLKESHLDAGGKQCFRMARSCAAADLDKAVRYASAMSNKGLFKMDSSVAPPIYRLLFRLFGFRTAEGVAGIVRNKN